MFLMILGQNVRNTLFLANSVNCSERFRIAVRTRNKGSVELFRFVLDEGIQVPVATDFTGVKRGMTKNRIDDNTPHRSE